MRKASYNCLGCIEALAQMPILICSANPLCMRVFPDDSIQLNHVYQAPQLVGNSGERYHKISILVEGKPMQGFSMSKTCAIKDEGQHFEQQILMPHISSQSTNSRVKTKTNYFRKKKKRQRPTMQCVLR